MVTAGGMGLKRVARKCVFVCTYMSKTIFILFPYCYLVSHFHIVRLIVSIWLLFDINQLAIIGKNHGKKELLD